MIRALTALGAGRRAPRARRAHPDDLVAIASGFAVALLLLAVSVPGALAARTARTDARSIVIADPAPGHLVAADIGLGLGAAGDSGIVVRAADRACAAAAGRGGAPAGRLDARLTGSADHLRGPDGTLLGPGCRTVSRAPSARAASPDPRSRGSSPSIRRCLRAARRSGWRASGRPRGRSRSTPSCRSWSWSACCCCSCPSASSWPSPAGSAAERRDRRPPHSGCSASPPAMCSHSRCSRPGSPPCSAT